MSLSKFTEKAWLKTDRFADQIPFEDKPTRYISRTNNTFSANCKRIPYQERPVSFFVFLIPLIKLTDV